MPYEIKVRDAVHFFGGPAELVRRLNALGDPVQLKAVEKWMERGTIPSPWLIVLGALARSEGRSFELSDFTREISTLPPNCEGCNE